MAVAVVMAVVVAVLMAMVVNVLVAVIVTAIVPCEVDGRDAGGGSVVEFAALGGNPIMVVWC